MSKRKRKLEIEYNPVCDAKSVHGYKDVRWVENVSRGLRLVGFADEIARKEGYFHAIDHKGWFTEDDGLDGEVYRGVVYQIPGRERKPQYAYGYADPNNKDCALLSFALDAENVMEAAKAADRFAEIFAEKERDYNRAWHAGRKYEELATEIKDMREEALAIGKEMREARRIVASSPTICATLRARILKLYRSIQKTRKERAELFDNYGRDAGFVD